MQHVHVMGRLQTRILCMRVSDEHGRNTKHINNLANERTCCSNWSRYWEHTCENESDYWVCVLSDSLFFSDSTQSGLCLLASGFISIHVDSLEWTDMREIRKCLSCNADVCLNANPTRKSRFLFLLVSIFHLVSLNLCVCVCVVAVLRLVNPGWLFLWSHIIDSSSRYPWKLHPNTLQGNAR